MKKYFITFCLLLFSFQAHAEEIRKLKIGYIPFLAFSQLFIIAGEGWANNLDIEIYEAATQNAQSTFTHDLHLQAEPKKIPHDYMLEIEQIREPVDLKEFLNTRFYDLAIVSSHEEK